MYYIYVTLMYRTLGESTATQWVNQTIFCMVMHDYFTRQGESAHGTQWNINQTICIPNVPNVPLKRKFQLYHILSLKHTPCLQNTQKPPKAGPSHRRCDLPRGVRGHAPPEKI
jgi:hypothetical protein